MPDVLIEEKRNYGIDCRKALWATDEIHEAYHACGLPEILCDADFVIETSDSILLVEYKNATVPDALAHATERTAYDPFQQKKFDKVVRKYYDSLHYLRLLGKEKPVHYIFVLEYPKGNSTSRKLLRNRLKCRLPFGLQERVGTGIKLIESVNVVSIDEWNANTIYGQFPMKPAAQLGT